MKAFRQLRLSSPPMWSSAATICSLGLGVSGTALLMHGPLRDGLLLFSTIGATTAWAWERWRSRQRLLDLSFQIGLGKLEIAGDAPTRALQQAINTLLQQQRIDNEPTVNHQPHMVTTLAISLPSRSLRSATSTELLEQLVTHVHDIAQQTGVHVQLQGNGVFVMVWGLDQGRPLAQTSASAVEVAQRLHTALPSLHFGLSCSQGTNHASPLGNVLIAPAIDDALRLVQMAHAWSEYTILCPEPLALLLAPSHSTTRTSLELTHTGAPPLRVYALELNVPVAVALGA